MAYRGHHGVQSYDNPIKRDRQEDFSYNDAHPGYIDPSQTQYYSNPYPQQQYADPQRQYADPQRQYADPNPKNRRDQYLVQDTRGAQRSPAKKSAIKAPPPNPQAPHQYVQDPFFGAHTTLQTIVPGNIKINYAARFRKGCCEGTCDGTAGRKYFWVLENGLEFNYPGTKCPCYTPTMWPFNHCKCPPCCCCPGEDDVEKHYYDRWYFDRQKCLFKIGCMNGEAEMFPGEIDYVCCCITLPQCCTQLFMCCCECDLCVCCRPWGNRVRFLPFHRWCCCCPTRACWIHNCCSCCGIKTGEPLPQFLFPIVDHLAEGTAQLTADEINVSRREWADARGKNLTVSYN